MKTAALYTISWEGDSTPLTGGIWGVMERTLLVTNLYRLGRQCDIKARGKMPGEGASRKDESSHERKSLNMVS